MVVGGLQLMVDDAEMLHVDLDAACGVANQPRQDFKHVTLSRIGSSLQNFNIASFPLLI